MTGALFGIAFLISLVCLMISIAVFASKQADKTFQEKIDFTLRYYKPGSTLDLRNGSFLVISCNSRSYQGVNQMDQRIDTFADVIVSYLASDKTIKTHTITIER